MRITFLAAATALVISTAAQSTNYPGWQSTMQYSKTSTGAMGYGNHALATSTIVYNPSTDTYTVRDTGSLTTTSSFGPANISSSNATFTMYSKNGGTETFRVLKQSPSNPLIALTYVDYGQWRRTSTANGVTSVNDTFLVWGTKSPSSAITTGSASYSTIVDGIFVNKTGSYTISGNGTFNANFTAGTISYSTIANATPETTGTAFAFGTMTGSGSIYSRGDAFQGTGTYNGSGYKMDVNGSFYGPSADEMGGVFHITTNVRNGGSGEGAIVGN